ncbi:apolipoprotein acyltransferase [Solimonas fluminis]|uniref:Apolipoprotein acyltransferase n=1 Tax=Solimonas fluminis TaxID=2086571 RepID=A0A2S5TLU0_9GAMM|nr:carbon-nitrogen hydrolase family protein [Solimonas fluminis]PPE75956.1 apolipoprotein acyltransferase [Solimonas fluminis]
MNPAIAAIQMNSSDRVLDNLYVAEQMLREAARRGAWLAVLPENFAFMGARERDKLAHAEPPGQGPIQEFLATISRELRLWVVAGTIPQAAPGDPDRVLAANPVYGADGSLAARYDKIHLFDVEVPGGESYRESNSIRPGEPNAVVAGTAVGKVGLSVCYDLRFPELYRRLAAEGAEILCVPSAFTARTGEAHWETLLRARAIENQCYVVASNQWGEHAGGRRTWGHSMIVGPWGEVLACQDDGAGVVLARPDRAAQAKLRQDFPVLSHRRLA